MLSGSPPLPRLVYWPVYSPGVSLINYISTGSIYYQYSLSLFLIYFCLLIHPPVLPFSGIGRFHVSEMLSVILPSSLPGAQQLLKSLPGLLPSTVCLIFTMKAEGIQSQKTVPHSHNQLFQLRSGSLIPNPPLPCPVTVKLFHLFVRRAPSCTGSEDGGGDTYAKH